MRIYALPAALAASIATVVLGLPWLSTQDMRRHAEVAAPEARVIEPVDADGWRTLGHARAAEGRHHEAIAAFANALVMLPDDASLLADYAFSAVVINGESAEPQRLVDRALQIDSKNQNALSLAGTLALDHHDYIGAARYWERLAAQQPPDSPMQRQVNASIAEVRRLASTMLVARNSNQR